MRKTQETYEDYIKAIYLASKKNRGGWVSNSDISKLLKINPSSVTNMLYKLKARKFIEWNPRKSLRLTEKGKKIANNLMRYYNNLSKFFSQVLKLEDKTLIKHLSCKIEHSTGSLQET